MEKNAYFEQIYQDYYRDIVRFLDKRVCNRATAEDIADDVFLAVYRNLDNYDQSRSFIATWLYAIACNRLKNYYKQCEKREYSYETIVTEKGELVDEGFNGLDRTELGMVLEKAMDTLSDRNRKVVRMRYFMDMNSTEIGRAMGMTPGHVRIVLKRSLEGMRKTLDRVWAL